MFSVFFCLFSFFFFFLLFITDHSLIHLWPVLRLYELLMIGLFGDHDLRSRSRQSVLSCNATPAATCALFARSANLVVRFEI